MFSIVSKTCRSAKATFCSLGNARLFSACRITLASSDVAEEQKRLERNEALRAYRACNRDSLTAAYHRARYERLKIADPEWYLKKTSQEMENARVRMQSDPHLHRRTKEYWRNQSRQSYSNNPHYKQRLFMHAWLKNNPWARDELKWKTHAPVYYSDKTQHHCTGCRVPKRRKLWWRSIQHPEQYDCHACFTSDWSRALPIGYEGFVFGQGASPKRPK